MIKKMFSIIILFLVVLCLTSCNKEYTKLEELQYDVARAVRKNGNECSWTKRLPLKEAKDYYAFFGKYNDGYLMYTGRYSAYPEIDFCEIRVGDERVLMDKGTVFYYFKDNKVYPNYKSGEQNLEKHHLQMIYDQGFLTKDDIVEIKNYIEMNGYRIVESREFPQK